MVYTFGGEVRTEEGHKKPGQGPSSDSRLISVAGRTVEQDLVKTCIHVHQSTNERKQGVFVFPVGTMTSLMLIMLMVWVAQAVEGSSCEPALGRSVTLVLSSRRNLTGHWNAQVTLKHGASGEDVDGRAVDISVEHRTDKCDNGEAVTVQVNLSAAPPIPGADYELYPGLGYYKFYTVPRRWREALAVCSSEDAHLAVVNSKQEAAVLKDMFGRHPNIPGSSHEQHAFLGFHDLLVEGQYTTVLGESLNSTGFVRWVDGQPNNLGYDGDKDSDCGGLERSGLLNDLPCNWRLPFFCEQQIWGTPASPPL